jgi:hypothetical protein
MAPARRPHPLPRGGAGDQGRDGARPLWVRTGGKEGALAGRVEGRGGARREGEAVARAFEARKVRFAVEEEADACD